MGACRPNTASYMADIPIVNEITLAIFPYGNAISSSHSGAQEIQKQMEKLKRPIKKLKDTVEQHQMVVRDFPTVQKGCRLTLRDQPIPIDCVKYLGINGERSVTSSASIKEHEQLNHWKNFLWLIGKKDPSHHLDIRVTSR